MYLGSWKIDDLVTFSVNTHNASTGAATDADAVPTYRVYEDETPTPILTGSMALLDSTNTAGFYSEQITLSAANGFEKGKSYTIYITATVSGVAGTISHALQLEAEVDANSVSSDVTTDSASRTASKADVSALALEASLFDHTSDTVITDSASRTASKATGFSTHSAADIWLVTTRTLSSFGTLIADIWTNVTRTITGTVTTDTASRTASKANVSALALASVATEARLAELDAANIPADIDAISTVEPDPAGTAATLHGITDGKVDAVQIDITTLLSRITANITTKAEMDAALALLATLANQTAMELIITNSNKILKSDEVVINDQLIKKDSSDHATVLQTFNLFKAGVPTVIEPDERVGT